MTQKDIEKIVDSFHPFSPYDKDRECSIAKENTKLALAIFKASVIRKNNEKMSEL